MMSPHFYTREVECVIWLNDKQDAVRVYTTPEIQNILNPKVIYTLFQFVISSLNISNKFLNSTPSALFNMASDRL